MLEDVYIRFKLQLSPSVLSDLCCSQVIYLTLKHNIAGSNINRVKTVKMIPVLNRQVHDPCEPSTLMPKASAFVAHVGERLIVFICP